MDIDTPRLLLRPLRLDDLPALTALLQDERVHPWVREDGAPSEGQVRRWIAQKMLAWARGTEAAWSVLRGGSVVGYVVLYALDRPVQAVSLAIDPAHWRHGLAREVLTAVLARSSDLGATEVWARVHRENAPAIALLCALGFEERRPIVQPPRRVFRWAPKP